MEALRLVLAFLVGGGVGYGFGLIQNRAARRYVERQKLGKLTSYTGVIPGSMSRVIYLITALVIVQLLCPIFFADGIQWWVSSGVIAGYGYILYQNLQAKRKAG